MRSPAAPEKDNLTCREQPPPPPNPSSFPPTALHTAGPHVAQLYVEHVDVESASSLLRYMQRVLGTR